MTSSTCVVAIDGPSGAGKGTVSRALARELELTYVDTGAMYRAVAWRALENGVSLDDEDGVARVARESSIQLGDTITIDGHDVSAAIRTSRMDAAAARVARLSGVRAALVERQRTLASGGRVVMEGRDIGTVVLPDADVKIFLDASPDERARRRSTDTARGAPAPDSVGTVATELAARDEQDRTRRASPLKRADDAVVVDTTGVPVDQVVSRVIAIVRARVSPRSG